MVIHQSFSDQTPENQEGGDNLEVRGHEKKHQEKVVRR
jgi:hypothetical protein